MNEYPDVAYLSNLASQAGRITLANFEFGMQREWKSDETPLTATDTAINEMVLRSLRCDFPHVHVIGEEGNNNVDGAEYKILLDPVDGTIPFCIGVPVSTFVISVVKENTPLVAVIYDPFTKRRWSAERGKGTWLNGLHQMSVSKHSTIHRSNICLAWWKTAKYNIHTVCQKLIDGGAIWMNPMSIGYFGGIVASGSSEGTIFPGQIGLETAAMQLIVEEAGGKVTDINGKPMEYGANGEIQGHIISNGLIHDELVEIVRSCQ